MANSKSGITDNVDVEVNPSDEQLRRHELVEDRPTGDDLGDVVLDERDSVPVNDDQAEEGVANPQRVILDTEHGWTAQSQHGVLLDHFVPTQDYQAIEADPLERIPFGDGKEDFISTGPVQYLGEDAEPEEQVKPVGEAE